MTTESANGDPSAHWLRRFADHLVERKLISPEGVEAVLKFRHEVDTRIGQLCALKGYITPRDVMYVVASQPAVNMPFGEMAVQQHLLMKEQLDDVLQLQQDPFRLFVESLWLTRSIPEETVRAVLKDFVEANRMDLRSGPAPEPLSEKDRSREALVPETRIFRPNVRPTLLKVKDVASIPAVAQKVLQMVDTPEEKLDDIVKQLETDPAICAQMLRLANSAFFGARGKVSKVRQAVITLGFRGVRQVVLTALVVAKFKGAAAERVKEVWWHSVVASQWAKALAKERRLDSEDAFVAGLIHEVGHPVILQYFPNAAEKIEKLKAKGSPEELAESEILGLTHADIGGYLCQYWTFPPTLSQAVLYHHAPVGQLRILQKQLPLTGLTAAACRLASLACNGEAAKGVDGLEEDFLRYHGFTREALGGLAPQVLGDARSMASLMR